MNINKAWRKIWNQTVVTVLRAIGRIKSVYPAKLKSKTRADFIEQIKKQNGDK
jgi:hypothetical protein